MNSEVPTHGNFLFSYPSTYFFQRIQIQNIAVCDLGKPNANLQTSLCKCTLTSLARKRQLNEFLFSGGTLKCLLGRGISYVNYNLKSNLCCILHHIEYSDEQGSIIKS